MVLKAVVLADVSEEAMDRMCSESLAVVCLGIGGGGGGSRGGRGGGGGNGISGCGSGCGGHGGGGGGGGKCDCEWWWEWWWMSGVLLCGERWLRLDLDLVLVAVGERRRLWRCE